MNRYILEFLNIFFLIFHTVFTIFNMTGWIFRRTRKLHLVTMSITAFSWGILGIWYGFGYCFCTDWHWQVRDALGLKAPPGSYIQFLIIEVTGISIQENFVDSCVLILFLVSLICSVITNISDYNKKRR